MSYFELLPEEIWQMIEYKVLRNNGANIHRQKIKPVLVELRAKTYYMRLILDMFCGRGIDMKLRNAYLKHLSIINKNVKVNGLYSYDIINYYVTNLGYFPCNS